MARRVRWTATAEADLADAFVELGAESPQAAERLLDVIETATAMLLRHPGLGRSCGFRSARAKDVRSWVLGFATRVLYHRGIEDGIEVIRMLTAVATSGGSWTPRALPSRASPVSSTDRRIRAPGVLPSLP